MRAGASTEYETPIPRAGARQGSGRSSDTSWQSKQKVCKCQNFGIKKTPRAEQKLHPRLYLTPLEQTKVCKYQNFGIKKNAASKAKASLAAGQKIKNKQLPIIIKQSKSLTSQAFG